ncbi:ABC transporter ATP-binding protein [Thalassorhabdomicrobium marinisediminis]|uniref:ABC transporter ATP-binding protein n=1 Tax=Thalassorhabdomicrobium marinisediminis TaxID=2170577 RepID=A0A2T7FXC1_9RHOB|nr:ABC transporter ATP-binding protein [Thalassorhabdomicrobium marinisediminis]PVA06821.1 ABC transporter ATP-binding protein [Thalassorhabdomicrobium marinisediminis]
MSKTKPAPNRSSKAMFQWLWRNYLRRHMGLLSVAVVLMVIEGSTFGVLSYMMKPMFDAIFIGGRESMIWIVGIGILALFFTRAVSALLQRVILKRVSEKSAAHMRTDLLRHLMQLDTAFHQIHPPGTLIERVQGDVQALNRVWAGLITGLGRDVVAVISLFSVALWIDWSWTLIALVGIPILVLPSYAIQGYVRRKARAARIVAADMSTRLDEVFHGINPIKLNSLEDYQARRYERLTGKRVRTETQAAFGQALIPGLVDIMAGLGFFAVLIYGGGQIIDGQKTVGEFMAFFTAMAIAFDPLRRLGNLSGLWQAAAASIDRLLDLFEAKPSLLSPASPSAPPTAAPRITFDDVSLSYGDLPVLHGASFVAEAGKTTALVGASGAGKSTLFNVLTRLVEPQGGAVTLDGTPINALSLTDLRALVSTVSQDAALFDETLRDNILLGRTDISDDVLNATLADAHVTDFLDKLSDGLDSPAGPRGSNLSGGQRQRVAIARALLRDTPILLLDEATSALDTKSESIVQGALDRLAKGRTTLVIAHRLSTIQTAHKIVVMDKGRVVDQGTHAELLARGGLYADLYRLQFRDGMQVVDGSNRPRKKAKIRSKPPQPLGWLARLFNRGPQD